MISYCFDWEERRLLISTVQNRLTFQIYNYWLQIIFEVFDFYSEKLRGFVKRATLYE